MEQIEIKCNDDQLVAMITLLNFLKEGEGVAFNYEVNTSKGKPSIVVTKETV